MTPDWSLVRLSEMADLRAAKIIPSEGDTRPYVALEHLAQGRPTVLGWSRAGTATSAKTVFRKGDVLFGKLRPNLRKAAAAPFDGLCSTDILPLFGKDGMDAGYLLQLAQWHRLQRHAVATSSGTKMPRTSWQQLGEFTFSLPPLPHQRKIAAILSSVDDAIEKTRAVIDQVQVVKRGQMQELLTRGLPGRHTRFKQTEIGEIPAEWGLVSLGDIGRWSSGGTPSKKEPRYWAGSIPWVSPKDMKVARLGDAIDHVSDAAIGNGARMTPRDSILIVVRGMILAHTFPVALTLTDVAFNQDMKALVADGTLAPEFLLYWFEDQQARILGLVDTSSHGTKRLPMSKLFAKQVPCPQRDEQEKITQLLHSHDSYRMAVLAEQAGLVTVKSALMSVLLTGEFRVTPDAEPA